MVDLLMYFFIEVAHRNTRYCVLEFTLSTIYCQKFFENCTPIVYLDCFILIIDVIRVLCHSLNLHIPEAKTQEKT